MYEKLLYQSLPSTFTFQQALERTKEDDFKSQMRSEEWVQVVIRGWLINGKIGQMERGRYRKFHNAGKAQHGSRAKSKGGV